MKNVEKIVKRNKGFDFYDDFDMISNSKKHGKQRTVKEARKISQNKKNIFLSYMCEEVEDN